MSHLRVRWCAGVFLFLSLAAYAELLPAAENSNLPRYRFEPGQRLTYHVSRSFKYGEQVQSDSSDWQITVLGKNVDGSYRVVITQAKDQRVNTPTAKQKKDLQCGYADIDAAGNVTELLNSFGSRLDPREVLAKLPDTEAEARGEWKAAAPFDCVIQYKPSAESGDATFVFESNATGPEHDVYGYEKRNVVTLDRARGLIDEMKLTTKQTFGVNSQGTGELKLTKVENCNADALAKWAADAERYFQAQKKFRDAGRKDDATAESMDEAAAQLTKVIGELQSEEFKELAEGLIDEFKQYRKYYLDEIAERKKSIGQAAHQFETTDLDGKPTALADYHGKVVLLDFWYRGCGWCIRCMPQLKEVADHYRGKPVALLGMNTDQNLEDAKFVVEKFGLNYPQLKAEGLPEKFKVHGFPTLILIDQQGKIRQIHSGWSPTLRDDLIKQVDAVLAEK
jgi:thiol-disulfide isomerase/thioredoxin